MKRDALVVSLVLLFAAFMWSCQQQDSAPLSPEGSITLGKKGGKPPAATYTIEVFFGNPDVTDPDPTVEGDFILVATEADAVANKSGTAMSGNTTTHLNLTQALRLHFLDMFNASGTNMGCFSTFFDVNGDPKITPITGQLGVRERDDPFDAVGFFQTADRVDPFLSIFMWGVIENDPVGEGVWRLPTPLEPIVVTGKTEVIPDPPPGGPDRLGIRVETGKGKNKEVCLQGIEYQPWRIVITLNP